MDAGHYKHFWGTGDVCRTDAGQQKALPAVHCWVVGIWMALYILVSSVVPVLWYLAGAPALVMSVVCLMCSRCWRVCSRSIINPSGAASSLCWAVSSASSLSFSLSVSILFCNSNVFWFSTNFELDEIIPFAVTFCSTTVMIKAITSITIMAVISSCGPVMAIPTNPNA